MTIFSLLEHLFIVTITTLEYPNPMAIHSKYTPMNNTVSFSGLLSRRSETSEAKGNVIDGLEASLTDDEKRLIRIFQGMVREARGEYKDLGFWRQVLFQFYSPLTVEVPKFSLEDIIERTPLQPDQIEAGLTSLVSKGIISCTKRSYSLTRIGEGLRADHGFA